MSTVAEVACHYALIKGYLLGRDAPREILIALDALHREAGRGPLQDDALHVIRRVSEAAEQLMARIDSLPEAADAVESITSSGSSNPETFPIAEEAAEGGPERATESDESKIAASLRDKGATVVDGPKKRKEWSSEARAAAAERMRARQAARKDSTPDHPTPPPFLGGVSTHASTAERDEAAPGNGFAPEESGAKGMEFAAMAGYEVDPRTGAIKIF